MHLTAMLLMGAIFGFLGVALGAFGAHALERRLTADRLGVYRTAVQYQMFHAVAILAVGVLCGTHLAGRPCLAAGWLFGAGIVLFSGSLYALAVGGPRRLGAVAPIGGVALLAGWVLLAVALLAGHPV